MKPKFEQPDYKRWVSVKVGMNREQVVSLLGKPLRDFYFGGTINEHHYIFGYLQMPYSPHPRTHCFMVYFDIDGKVCGKSDPFDGVFSTDGRPSKPRIIIPTEKQAFTHYPRIVDIRWFPCSGVYPLSYTVEIGTGSKDWKFMRDEEYDSDLYSPYFVTTHAGTQPGRIRIRGRNSLGYGEWSDYRFFEFIDQAQKI
jgi:hypothetical protein